MKLIQYRKAILLLLFIGAALVRLINLGNFGIWYDEKISLLSAHGISELEIIATPVTTSDWYAAHSKDGIVQATIENTGGNSLLYHFGLHFWTNAFGNSDFVLRLFSVIFGLLLLWPFYLFARRLTGSEEVALIALSVLCFHPLMIEFSREAKSYAMAGFFCSCSTLVLLKSKAGSFPFSQGLLYALLCLAALMCHYFTVYVFLFHFIILLIWKTPSRDLLRYVAHGGIALAGFGLWYFAGGQEGLTNMSERNKKYELRASNYSEGDDPFYIPASTSNIAKGWFQVTMPVAGNQLQKMGFRIREVFPLLLVPILILWFGWKKGKHRALFHWLWSFPVYLLLMTLLAYSSGHCISFQPLYAQFTIPFFAVVFAYSIYQISLLANRLLTAAAIGVLLITAGISASSSIFDYSLVKTARKENDLLLLEQQLKTETPPKTLIFGNSFDALLFGVYAAKSGYPMSSSNSGEAVVELQYSGALAKRLILNNY